MTTPEEMAERIAREVEKKGGRTYYVGGFVRDRVLGIENKDVDIEVHGVTAGVLEQILDGLGERTQMGASFGVYGLKHLDLDIALPRKEEATGRGHRDFAVFTDPWLGTEKAARRRDGAPIFASEPKNLVGLCDRILPFPPGHYYKDGKFVCYRDVATPKTHCTDDLETACKKIHDKLTLGIEKRLDADAPVGFLLSGGLDSSLVCAVAARASKKPIKTFSIGMDLDAIDLKYAREVADYIGADHTEVIITKQDVLEALPQVVALLGTYDITTIRASIGMYLVCKYIHEHTDLRVLLTGEISDELFGYKYTDFAPSAEEFQKEAEKRIRELHMYDVLRADRCISVNSLEARVPFGDLDFVEYVMALDPEMKRNHYGKGKYLLRHAFEGDYLPQDILMREKAAFSDAVGHSMVDDLKEYAESQYTEEEFRHRAARYTHARPFTKESLLYRELFERYYPGQAQMVVDFWMPNKTWEGCDVKDPSARVLSNYGDSGK